MTDSMYRTLLLVELEQITAMAVGQGGTELETEAVFRDGAGKLTIPGTSLAGAFVEAAVRTGLMDLPCTGRDSRQQFVNLRISGKRSKLLQKGDVSDEDSLASVWSFEDAHIAAEQSSSVLVQLRQGVGIRHATGAAASEHRALFDCEFIPAGTVWRFLLDIDVFRGGVEAEQLALLAVGQLDLGQLLLGKNAARGMGRFRITGDSQCIRLPLTPNAVKLWPRNDGLLDWGNGLAPVGKTLATWQGHGVERTPLREAVQVCQQDTLKSTQNHSVSAWHYLHLEIDLSCGPGPLAPGTQDSYGWDALHVGGHPAVGIYGKPLSSQGSQKADDGPNQMQQESDAPFVSMLRSPKSHLGDSHQTKREWEPYLPGSGLRGPLRHAASRIARSRGELVPDPLDKHARLAGLTTRASTTEDSVSDVFGVLERSGNILFEDAHAKGPVQIIRVDQVALDEFTGGVFGSSKFDTDIALSGSFGFRLTIEASDIATLANKWAKIADAINLAERGYVPMGGSKTRGAGWLKWRVHSATLSNSIGATRDLDVRSGTSNIGKEFSQDTRLNERDSNE